MLDDTCYFLSFNNLKYAEICTVLLNSRPVQDFLESIVFLNSKRPYTKDILKRIDLFNICQKIDYNDFLKFALGISIKNITKRDYEKFKDNLKQNKNN